MSQDLERVLRRFATKSDGEKEDEESERLVREAPKVKPPRRDRRRERVRTEQDPDLKDPSSAENDPDLSMNYKTIGGSSKSAANDLINVRLKNDPNGRVVQVTKETLRTQSDKYEEVGKSEKPETGPQKSQQKPDRAAPPTSPPQGQDRTQLLSKAHESLQEMAQTDQELASILKDFTNPSSDIFQFVKARPDTPVAKFLRGRTPPKGIKTMKDLQEALLFTPSDAEAPQKNPSKGKGPTKEGLPQQAPERESEPEGGSPTPPGYPEKPYTKTDLENARLQIVRTFPTQIATDLLLVRPPIHPDEVSSMVSDFHAAKSLSLKDSSIEKVRKDASKFYAVDPSSVSPPKTVEKDGAEVDFNSLPESEQAKALRKHQIQTVAMSMAAREVVRGSLEKSGAPKELADKLAGFMFSGAEEAPAARQKRAAHEAEALFYKGLEEGAKSRKAKKVSDVKVANVLNSLEDPSARKLAVGYFQAQDYNEARDKYLDPTSKENISERLTPRVAAQRLSKAMDFLRERAERYPKGTAEDVASTFRTRVMRHLSTLAPEKHAQMQDFMDEADNKHYDKMLAHYKREMKAFERARKQAEKDFSKDYKEYSARLKAGEDLDPPLSSQDRLAEIGLQEPPEPVKPPRYDLKRKSEQELEQTASDMWDKFRERTASVEKVAARAQFHSFSSYPDTFAMGKKREAVYWGVEPEPVEAYPDWAQHQARDLEESDFNKILTAARGWMKAPVLASPIEGIVKDTQLRAALDLAIQTEGYRNALHPWDYNNLLARLAGKPQDETLLTVREVKMGSGYNEQTEIAYRIPGKGGFKRKKFKSEEAANKWLEKLEEKEGKVEVRWQKWASKESEMLKIAVKYEDLYVDEVFDAWYVKDGKGRTVSTFGEYSTRNEAVRELKKRLKQNGYEYSENGPNVKKAHMRSGMPNNNVELETSVADRILGRLDRVASEVQEKHESWGMSFEAAKAVVNEIDKIADELEESTYGAESMITRQAQVLQRDSDEAYMDTFQNPQSPHQVEADEPYMQAYSSDDSSGVHHGKAENGRPLAK